MSWPVRYLPKWFPGASFHREAEAYRKVLNDMVNVPFDIVKRQLVIVQFFAIVSSLTPL